MLLLTNMNYFPLKSQALVTLTSGDYFPYCPTYQQFMLTEKKFGKLPKKKKIQEDNVE